MSRLFDEFGMKVDEGEVIFREGDEAECLYMIHKGRVKITRESSFGDEEISVLGEREFFGEMALISSEPRSASAIALEETWLIKMDQEAFEQSIRENQNLAVSVVRLLTRRLREADDLITALMDHKKTQTVYEDLLITLLREGKRDSARRYILADQEEFMENVTSLHNTDRESIEAILSQLQLEERILVKRVGEGKSYLAIPLAED